MATRFSAEFLRSGGLCAVFFFLESKIDDAMFRPHSRILRHSRSRSRLAELGDA